MRVLLISHTCQSRSEGQPKAEHLARFPELALRVLTPHRWLHYGHWRRTDLPSDPGYELEVGRVAMPWMGPGQFYLHTYPGLIRTLQSFQPDIIDLWEEPWSLVSAHACWLRNRFLPRTKIISETEQNIDKDLPPPFRWFRRYSLRNADFAIGRNQEAIDVLHARGYSGPAEVVPNAVDTGLFRPLDREKCRAQLGLSGFVVGYVGRLVPEKGLEDLVHAIARCRADISLLCVGEGPAAKELLEQAAQLGIKHRIRLLPSRPASELPAIMNAIDCLSLPSRTTRRWKEQFGRVIIEAHACGTPVVGSNSGAIPEVVGQGGIVVPEQDPIALAAAIHTLANDAAQCRRMGQLGRQAVLSGYTWQHVAERMFKIYRQLCDGMPRNCSEYGAAPKTSCTVVTA